MEIIKTDLPGPLIIKPQIFKDARGFFYESYQKEKFQKNGILEEFIQDNQSSSVKGTLRGLHYQLKRPQAKLCRVIKGSVFDVAVDIRKDSPSFGKWTSVILSEENQIEFYIPSGFAHGFCVLSERAEFLYKCSDYYYPEDSYGIIWNDPELKIDWPLANPLLSEKDAACPSIHTIDPQFLPIK